MSRARDTANQINRVNSSAADATAITVDSSENVGIGTSTPVALSNQKSLTINGTSVARLDLQGTGQLYANSTEMVLQGSYGKTVAIDGGTNKHISFRYATAEKMRLDNDGLKFNGDTAAANALNDYEEGTFTPTVFGGSNAGTAGSGQRVGKYTKIGRQVNVQMKVDYQSHTGSGELRFGNLPFTSGTNTPSEATGTLMISDVDINGSRPHLTLYMSGGVTYCQIFQSGDNIGWSSVDVTNEIAAFRLSLTYFTS